MKSKKIIRINTKDGTIKAPDGIEPVFENTVFGKVLVGFKCDNQLKIKNVISDGENKVIELEVIE